MKVFAYEPDALEREFLHSVLSHEGYQTELFSSEHALLPRFLNEPDATVLISVSDAETGTWLCKRIRAASRAPIIAIAERADEELAARLYEEGADEVIARPFRTRLFVARLENMRRRTSAPAHAEREEKLVVGDYQLLPARMELRKAGHVIHLTPVQTRLLYHLMANAGKALSKERLEDKVWGYSGEAVTNVIKTHIRHLRQKVEANPDAPEVIQTVKGLGYRFAQPQFALATR